MPSRLLYVGCQPGQDVMDLQDGLNAVSGDPGQISAYPALVVDGVFGGKTGSRVREFQQHNGLSADGIVGPATWAVLLGLLQGIPGLQISRPIGGSGSGPAKGTDGSAVHGKQPAGGGKDPAGSGGSQAKGTGPFAGQKSGPGGTPPAGGAAKGVGSGFGNAGGGKAIGGGAGQGGSAAKAWGSAYGGSYTGGGGATSLKGDGGDSGGGGGVKGGNGKKM